MFPLESQERGLRETLGQILPFEMRVGGPLKRIAFENDGTIVALYTREKTMRVGPFCCCLSNWK